MQRWLWLLPLHASALITKARWGSITTLVCKQPSNCSLPLDANLRCAIDASLAASFHLSPFPFALKLSFSDIFSALLHVTNNSQGSSFSMKILVYCSGSQSPSAMLGTHGGSLSLSGNDVDNTAVCGRLAGGVCRCTACTKAMQKNCHCQGYSGPLVV